MSIRKAFVQEEILRKRKRLGWLSWIAIVITTTFLIALGVLAWRAMSEQPAPIVPGNPNQVSSDDAVTLKRTTVPALDLVQSPATVPIELPKAWAVWKTKDALGQDIWDAAPEIKAWVIRDYLAALKWNDDNLFEREYVLEHLGEYYADKRLTEMRAIITWEIKNNKVFAISSIKRLPLGTMIATFSQDGKQATLLDYHAAGRGQIYNLDTRKLEQGDTYPNTMHMLEMQYDDATRRWKIARERMNYDLDNNRIIWQEGWSGTK